jgi:hypothetical protein
MFSEKEIEYLKEGRIIEIFAKYASSADAEKSDKRKNLD